jgi:hypothetical protein
MSSGAVENGTTNRAIVPNSQVRCVESSKTHRYFYCRPAKLVWTAVSLDGIQASGKKETYRRVLGLFGPEGTSLASNTFDASSGIHSWLPVATPTAFQPLSTGLPP